MTDRFGELVRDLDVLNLKGTTISTLVIFSFARRASMAVIIVHIPYMWAQVMLMMYINQAYMMFVVYYRLYEDKKEWVIQCLNEIIIVITVYHLFCLTDWVTDLWIKQMVVGISMISMTGLNMGINLGPLLPELFKHSILRVKRFKGLNKVRKLKA